MSHILVLSAHDTQLDRRIAAEANTLVASGREVTLLSVPTKFPIVGLDPRIRLIVDAAGQHEKKSLAKSAAKMLPRGIREAARSLWYRYGSGPAPYNKSYFLANVPHENFDGIHCHDLKTLPAGTEIRALYSKDSPLIYDSHEFFPFQSTNPSFQKYWIELESKHIREADLVITINQSIAQELETLYGVEKPEIIYNSYGPDRDGAASAGGPLDKKAFLQHFEANCTGLKVLFQGSMTQERNLRNLVLAFGQIKLNASLFFLGSGPEEEALRAICKKKKIRNVFFGDWVPQEQLMQFVVQADMGIIPYRGDNILNNYYCTPNKLFEYIEARVPICASDLPELRSIVRDRRIGDVYPMGDPAEIAQAIDACLDRVASGEFTPEALDAAREEFSWAGQEKNLLRLYDNMGL